MTSPALIARVKESVDLLALVSAYAEIRQSRILCPWHSEKRPSCRVYEDHVFCYTCNNGGDAFAFLQQVEGIPFHEALKRLADAAGISLDEQPVTRKQMVYAREEAECCRWWWARRHERMVAQAQRDYDSMPDTDLGWCAIIDMPLAADAKLTIAERFAFFRAKVTEAERAEFRAWQAEERERRELRASVMEWACEILTANVEYAKAHGFKDWDEFIQKYGAEAFLALNYVEIPALAAHAK